MGRRSEQRIATSLPVIVRGIDSNGNPSTRTARTHDVSASAARLEGLVDAAEARESRDEHAGKGKYIGRVHLAASSEISHARLSGRNSHARKWRTKRRRKIRSDFDSGRADSITSAVGNERRHRARRPRLMKRRTAN